LCDSFANSKTLWKNAVIVDRDENMTLRTIARARVAANSLLHRDTKTRFHKGNYAFEQNGIAQIELDYGLRIELFSIGARSLLE